MLKALLTITLILSNLFGGIGDSEPIVISGLERGTKQVVIYEDYDSIIDYRNIGEIEVEESKIEKLNEDTMLEYTEDGIFQRYNYTEYNMEEYSKITSYYIEDVVILEIWEK